MVYNFVYSLKDCICLLIDMVVTCSWFVFNAIIVIHLLELTFYQRSTSCVRPGHVMVFLIVLSVLVCPG
jgi:hypothetical protein